MLDGIPVTTPARTLLDVAGGLDDAELARAVNEARLRRLVTREELVALVDRSPGRATTRLRARVEPATGPTRSRFEDAFLMFAERHRLPPPEVNETVAGHEVDLLWSPRRMIVELDSREHHEHRFEADRERDADLLDAGFSVLRITWRRLAADPAREAARLRDLLARRARPER